MNKDTKSNHPSPSEDSLLQSKICRPMGLWVRVPPGLPDKKLWEITQLSERKTREKVIEEIVEELPTITEEPFRVDVGRDEAGASIDIFLDETQVAQEVMEKYRLMYPKQRIIVIIKTER